MAKFRKRLLLATMGMTLCLSGCAMTPTVMIVQIETHRKRVQEEKAEKERLQKEAILQERRIQEYQKNKRQLEDSFEEASKKLEAGDLKNAKKYLSKEFAKYVKDSQSAKTYYGILLKNMNLEEPVIDGDTATITFTSRRIKNKSEVVAYLKSDSFLGYLEQERIAQNLWTDEDISKLKQSLIESEIANSKLESCHGTITYKRLNETWLLESITDEEGILMVPIEGEFGLC